MDIHIVMVMHTIGKEPYELVRALAGDDTTFHVFLHSHEPEALDAFNRLPEVSQHLRLNHVGFNRGLAYSWNQGLVDAMDEGADTLFIANDDAEVNRTDMLRMAEAAHDVGHEYYMINAQGLHVQGNLYAGLQLALAAVTPLWIEKIGAFDENFLFCYHEDVDLYKRAILQGLQTYSIGDTSMRHLGSMTIRSSQRALHQLQTAVPRNEIYYAEKWGGPNGHEPFDRPFNNSAYGLKIPFENRHCPYPDHQRTDLDELLAIE